MSPVTEILYIVGLFVLRLGIPLAITLIIAYFLRRLDAKWEDEARSEQEAGRVTREVEEEKTVSVPLAHVPPPAPISAAFDSYGKPCWEINKDCNPIKMEHCPAYQDPSVPCWQARRQAEGRIPVECYHCEIFLAIQPPDLPQISQELHH